MLAFGGDARRRNKRLVTAYRDRSKAGLAILTSFYQQHIHGHG